MSWPFCFQILIIPIFLISLSPLFLRYPYLPYCFTILSSLYAILVTINCRIPSSPPYFDQNFPNKHHTHRKRKELEDQAKVVASDWGAEFVPFLAMIAVLPWSISKNRRNSTFSFKYSRPRQNSQRDKELNILTNSAHQTDATAPLPCLLIPSFFYDPLCYQSLSPQPNQLLAFLKAKSKLFVILRTRCFMGFTV